MASLADLRRQWSVEAACVRRPCHVQLVMGAALNRRRLLTARIVSAIRRNANTGPYFGQDAVT